jgi:hypothetical protein
MPEIKDKKPGLQERYGRAVNATRLKVEQTRITDIDSLIAAGWVMGGAAERRRQRQRAGPARNRSEYELAPLLFRLHVEWDAVKGNHGLALKRQLQLEEAVKSAAREVSRLMLAATQNKELLAEKVQDLEALRAQAKREALSDYSMMLAKVRTLEPARDALGRWATIEATKFPLQGVRLPAEPRRRKDETDEQLQARHAEWHRRVVRVAQENSLSDKAVAGIAGRVLRSWLDPRCRPCGGAGLTFLAPGGKKAAYGAAIQAKCSVCRGTGLVHESLGDNDAERRFARHMLDRMAEMLSEVERDLRHFIHSKEGAA